MLYIGIAVVVAGGGIIWYRKYEANSQATASANADAQSQSDAELAAMMLEQNSSTASNESSATVSGPTVDTGNSELQALVSSILNPTSTTTNTSSSASSSTTPATPVSTLQTTPVTSTSPIAVNDIANPQPIIAQSGGNIITQSNGSISNVATTPVKSLVFAATS